MREVLALTDTGAWRDTPAALLVTGLAKPGPSCALGTMTPFGQSRRGTPEGVLPLPRGWGQCRSPQGCGGYGTASYGVPLPFISFVSFFVARMSEAKSGIGIEAY